MDAIDRIPSIVDRLYELVAELEKAFPGRPFTPDGHLVDSLGEVLASHYYALELLPCSSECHDAKSNDGRLVQVKATQGKSVALRAEPHYLLVIALRRDGTIQEVYNGPGREPWRNAGATGRNGQRPISLSRLRRLAEDVLDDQRLPRAL
jgi:uncharacterized protein DUF6998